MGFQEQKQKVIELKATEENKGCQTKLKIKSCLVGFLFLHVQAQDKYEIPITNEKKTKEGKKTW